MSVSKDSFNVIEIISRAPWFKNLPATAHEELAKGAKLELMKSNDYVFGVGQRTDSIFCILTGWVRVSVNSADGDEFALTDLQTESWAGEASLFNDKPRVIDLHVKKDAWVLKIHRSVVNRIGEQYPSMYRDVAEYQVDRARGVYELLAGMVLYPLKSRLAGRLLSMADETGRVVSEGIQIPQKMSQSDLARLCMGSRQRVNKILREWQNQSLVVMLDDHYVITSLERLSEEVELSER